VNPGRLLGLIWILVAFPVAAHGQSRLFPAGPTFELPLASPRTNDITARVIRITSNESQFGPGTEAEVAVGEDFPLVALRRGPRPISFGFGAAVYGRYRLNDPASSQISNDWTVGINVTADLHPWDLTLQLYHESSHIGDEYHDTFSSTPRVDWTRQVLAAWAGYHFGPWRAAAELSYSLVIHPDIARTSAALALDYRGHDFHFLGRHTRPLGGVFAEAWAYSDWKVSPAAKLGLGFRGERAPAPEMRFSFIVHSGLSTQRQFYQAPSTYFGFELQFDL
jgi:hypothetical protein